MEDEMDEMREEFQEVAHVARANADCLNVEYFTFENYLKAHYHVGTRCFGYAIPELSLVPFADNANHQATDIQYELFNSRFSRKIKESGENSLTATEKNYITAGRKKVNFLKNFSKEDLAGVTEPVMTEKSLRYARKV